MHFSLSMNAGFFVFLIAYAIASHGPFLTHIPHILHVSGLTIYLDSTLHAPALQLLSFICSSYSSLKYLIMLNTGFGAVCPSPHRDAAFTVFPSSTRVAISFPFALPAIILCNISRSLFVPIRHGTHFPHDSSVVKFRKNLAISTMHDSSSITTMPPEPMIAPTAASVSYSTGVSIISEGMQPPDGPPV